MNMFKKNGGFTLVELIVVIAILAILAAVAVPAYSGYINKAQDASNTTALASVKTAVLSAFITAGEVEKIAITTDEEGKLEHVTVYLVGGSVNGVPVLRSGKVENYVNDNTPFDEAAICNEFWAYLNKTLPVFKGSLVGGFANWTPETGWDK